MFPPPPPFFIFYKTIAFGKHDGILIRGFIIRNTQCHFCACSRCEQKQLRVHITYKSMIVLMHYLADYYVGQIQKVFPGAKNAPMHATAYLACLT